jgi:hypothetical protein
VIFFLLYEIYKYYLGRPRHRWEDNLNRDSCVTVWEGVDWIDLA